MMFLGAVASSVRQVLAAFAREIELPVLICGAGNFTVPSALRAGGYAGLVSACDVSLYTSALGAYLAGWRLDASQSEHCPEHLRGLLRPDTPADLAASIALILDLREVWKADNPFKVRALGTFTANYERLLAETKRRLETFKEAVGEIAYEAKDGFALLEERDPAHTVFAFPPTYKRGYEQLEKLLRLVVDWTPPEYREMTDKSLELYELIARFESYFVVLDKELPEVHAILGEPVATLPRGRGRATYVMARKAARRFVVRPVVKSRDITPIWPADRPVAGEETPGLAVIALAQSLRLNELFLSARIDYFTGGVGLSVAFLLDGHVFGKADFCPSSHRWKLPDDRPMIYVMCDLAVPSVEPRLAKLVLLSMLSREVKELIDLKYVDSFGWACTTAFSRGPVSMKYRGVFKLHSRKETDGGFSLNYCGEMGVHGLAEVLGIWRKKFSK